MKGKKYNDDIREKAIALLATNNNIAEIARQLELKESTLRSWKKQLEEGKEKDKKFAELRDKKKTEFIDRAWESIELASNLVKRRLERAMFQEDELDDLQATCLEGCATPEEKRTIRNKFAEIKLEDIGKLSTVLGVLYDKQALAGNGITSRVGIRLEDMLEDVKGEEY